ncbi:MAG: hypothetical protein COV67_10875 [Nitrospinae bacterium CG11_big_fil_rev_8_21_14_0_20_56_8]|nr:MAG: hypothetical protein COV67_10875 [Nitrospinae bacterium CG11_big_fil_rev_8_21_14_0_20_56_8]
MSETMTREIDCVLCKESFSPVFQPKEGETGYKIYCSSCSNWFPMTLGNPVRVMLKEVLGLRDEPLALALQTCLNACPCGGEFNHDAGRRCFVCLEKIEQENRHVQKSHKEFHCPYNLEAMKKFESRIFTHLMGKVDEDKKESLQELIERFEAGEIDAETYLENLDRLQFREVLQGSVIKTWAMILGPEMAFRAAEEHDMVEKFGSRFLVSIANGLELSTGRPLLATLGREVNNWDGQVEKELKMFLRKIGGGF